MIRKIKKQELEDLIPLFRDAFDEHGLFYKPDPEVMEYLNRRYEEGTFLVAVEEDKLVGTLLVLSKEPTPGHILAGFKHIAVAQKYQGKGIGTELLKEAEKIIGKGKIEIHTVGDLTDYYVKRGYAIEGELKSHYRPGETCYILGKVI
jgi:ribosomal protein S18 acetylase RimI-like enzyme